MRIIARFLIRDRISLRFSVCRRIQVIFIRVISHIISLRQTALLIKARIKMKRRHRGQFIHRRFRDVLDRTNSVSRCFYQQVTISRHINGGRHAFLTDRSVRDARVYMEQASASSLLYRFNRFKVTTMGTYRRDVNVTYHGRRRARYITISRLFTNFHVHSAFTNFLLERSLNVAVTTFYLTIIAGISSFSPFRTSVFFNYSLLRTFFITWGSESTSAFNFHFNDNFRRVTIINFYGCRPFQINFDRVNRQARRLIIVSRRFTRIINVSFPINSHPTKCTQIGDYFNGNAKSADRRSQIRHFQRSMVTSRDHPFRFMNDVRSIKGQFFNGSNSYMGNYWFRLFISYFNIYIRYTTRGVERSWCVVSLIQVIKATYNGGGVIT